MLCSSCKKDNPTDAAFCEQCGSKLELICPSCKAAVSPGARFCKKCGTAVGVALPAPATKSSDRRIRVADASDSEDLEGERKTVTALFADIKGSTELERVLDPEEARAIIDPALNLMINAVNRYGGYLVQSTGDGVFAVFGAPIAYEDHARRALHAALRMQEDLRRYGATLQQRGTAPIETRVGVDTGEVVMRSITTREGHTEYTPIGHAVNLASRMQALARTGTVVVSDSTRKLVEGYFALKSLGVARAKGIAEPVSIYEVTGIGPLRTRLQRSGSRGYTKFVGREREMETLRHAAEQATAGRGQIVAAIADAGVGKSRLLFEFKATSQSGWMVLETSSVSHEKASAYLPVIDLLHGYLKIGVEDDPRARRAKVTGYVLNLDRALEDTLPLLFALLGVVEGEDPLAQMDGQIKKRRTLEAIKRLLLRESLNQPLMVIFEDLHWIDDETQALLNLLADSIGTAKILLLVNYRPEYSHPWGSKTYYTQLRLHPLGEESAGEMLSALLGDGVELGPLKRLIIAKTEGNPLFMEEIFQALVEDGSLQRNGGVKLVRAVEQLRLPQTVQGIMASRIDRLPADEKDLLQTLAVIGKEFPLSLAREVVKKPDDELGRMLNDLQLAEFIYEQPAVGDIEYTFKHALTRQVAYDSLLNERRRQIHDRTARAMETLNLQQLEDHYGALARHYLLGNDVSSALRYARLAADQAVSRAAYPEAASMLDAALKQLERLPAGAERLRAEMTLRSIESTAAFAVYGGASTERERAITRMCELGEEIGEADQMLEGLIALSSLYLVRGECTRGFELTSRCLELAEPTRDAELLADIRWNRGLLAEFGGNLQGAVPMLEDGLAYAERSNRRYSGDGFLFRASFKTNLAQTFQLLGRDADATKFAEEALQHARDSKHLFSICFALTNQFRALLRRESEIVRAYTEEGIALSKKGGFALWLAIGRVYHGWAVAELGQLKAGVEEMEEAVATIRRLGGFPREQYAIALLARAYAGMGRSGQALPMLDGALAHIERTGQKAEHAEMLRLRGEVLLTSDGAGTQEAENCFRAARQVARAQEASWWELRATVSLARLLRDTNRRDEARAMLAEIYNCFTEGFDTADLKDAKALLNELSV